MRQVVGLTMQLVAYVCVATVLAALFGMGYLWNSGKLTNEKMFHISAIIHNTDLDRLAEEQQRKTEEVPPEEPSLEELQRHRTVAIRENEMKSDQLRRQIAEFKHMWDLLAAEMERRDKSAKIFDERLAQAEADVVSDGNSGVARHFNLMKEQQVKDELMKMIDAGEMKKAVPLLNQMADAKLRKVFKQFKTDEEKSRLLEIHQLMRKGFPRMDVIDETRQDLQDLKPDNQ